MSEQPLCDGPILLTGATGYVGGRLLQNLEARGQRVRCLTRRPEALAARVGEHTEVVRGDLRDVDSLRPAMQGVRVAYYLVHNLGEANDFVEAELQSARNFAQAAREAGVERIIYLGGLGDPASDLSEHLRSRQATGDALRGSGVPVTEFRAAVIVGSGSTSFEMIRYLTERLPVMICPRWVSSRIQPIGIEDVLDYLVAGAVESTAGSESPSEDGVDGSIVEIGGADVVTYLEMMRIYAEERGLPRLMWPVPVLSPGLSAAWVHLITPIPASIARPLIEGLRNEVIVRDDTAGRRFPDIQPAGYRASVREALAKLDADQVETAWSDALASTQGDEPPVVLKHERGMLIERRTRVLDAELAAVYRAFAGIGGRRGWYMGGLWRLRGALDRMIGGVGFRRGRRDPDDLRVGDALDFWRVEAVDPGRRILLRAEMKMPGAGWLEYRTDPADEDGGAGGKLTTRLTQTAYFAPKGLTGLVYWYALYPVHAVIFSGLIDSVASRAERGGRNRGRPAA